MSKRVKNDPEDVVLIFDNVQSGTTQEPRMTIKELYFRNASPVFAEMLKVAIKKGKPKEFRLPVLDFKLATIFKRFLEEGSSKKKEIDILDDEEVFSLLEVAYRYKIHSLSKDCVSRIYKRLTVDNVFTVLRGIQYFKPELRSDCFNLIIRAAFVVFKSDCDFGWLTEEEMEYILSSEYLNVLNEQQAFEFLVKWGKVQYSKKRNNTAKVIINLAPYIKWSHLPPVGNLDSDWRKFALSQIKKSTAVRNTVASRNPPPTLLISLIPYSKSFIISKLHDYDSGFDKSQRGSLNDKPFDLITFCLDFDAYLIGFESFFIIASQKNDKLEFIQASLGTENGGYSPLKAFKLRDINEVNFSVSFIREYALHSCSFETTRLIRIPKGEVRSLCVSVELLTPKIYFPHTLEPLKLSKGNAVFTDSESHVLRLKKASVCGVKKLFFLPE